MPVVVIDPGGNAGPGGRLGGEAFQRAQLEGQGGMPCLDHRVVQSRPGSAHRLADLQDKLGAAGKHAMAEAAELAADLGYLPLALAQVATFIRDRRETCAGYRRRLRDQRRRLSEILPEDALADDYRTTVAATWSISVERADALPPVGLARPVLILVSTLDPNGVPIDVVTSSAARTFIAGQPAPSSPDGRAAVDEQDCRMRWPTCIG